MVEFANGLRRVLCFHSVWGYPPTRAELLTSLDSGPDTISPQFVVINKDEMMKNSVLALAELLASGQVVESGGRFVLGGQEEFFRQHAEREALFPRKLRKALRVTNWLRRLPGVRYVALCNTTAVAHARQAGDLDFFIIAKQGTLWQTRLAAVTPFKLMSDRPTTGRDRPDAVCFSFFIDDQALDLSPLCLAPDDPYFRYWFLSLLSLYDDGVGPELWLGNKIIRLRHPLAEPWGRPIFFPPAGKFPTLPFLEQVSCSWQKRLFPPAIRLAANSDSGVSISDHVLKFHLADGREQFRISYQKTCERFNLQG